MKKTLQSLTNTLKDDEWVFPGHGSYGKFKDIKNNLINIQNSL
jgi:glyoxylase-like metal-dependent hydrolase (beta-lactamase superfamily II)